MPNTKTFQDFYGFIGDMPDLWKNKSFKKDQAARFNEKTCVKTI